jgi:hypothetical protein
MRNAFGEAFLNIFGARGLGMPAPYKFVWGFASPGPSSNISLLKLKYLTVAVVELEFLML